MILVVSALGCVAEEDAPIGSDQADQAAAGAVTCAAARFFPPSTVEPMALEVKQDDVGKEFERTTHRLKDFMTFRYALTASLPRGRDHVSVIFRDLDTEVGVGTEGTFNDDGEFLFSEDQSKNGKQEFVFLKCCRGTKECDPLK